MITITAPHSVFSHYTHRRKEIWGYGGVSNNILQIYNPAIFYCHRTSLCLLAIFQTNKIRKADTCTPTEWWKREATIGFLTTFYKYMIQQYFIVQIFYRTPPHLQCCSTCTSTEWWKREATMGFLTIFYKYIIQQYFIVQIFYHTPPHLQCCSTCTSTEW